MLTTRTEQRVALPELRKVTYRPPNRSWRTVLTLLKVIVVMTLLAGAGLLGKDRYRQYRHDLAEETHRVALQAHQSEQYEQAEGMWQKALLEFRATGDNKGQLTSYLWLAKNAHQAGEPRDALAFLNLATDQPELGESSELEEMKDDLYLSLGVAALEDGLAKLDAELFEEAAEAGMEALDALENGEAEDQEMAAVHRLLGFCQLELGQKISAADHLSESLQFEKNDQVASLLKELQPDPKPLPEIKRTPREERRSQRRALRSRPYNEYLAINVYGRSRYRTHGYQTNYNVGHYRNSQSSGKRVARVTAQATSDYPVAAPREDEDEDKDDRRSISRRSRRVNDSNGRTSRKTAPVQSNVTPSRRSSSDSRTSYNSSHSYSSSNSHSPDTSTRRRRRSRSRTSGSPTFNSPTFKSPSMSY